MGRLADYAWPEPIGKAVVNLYCRAYDVELDECRKTSGFASFDEFFTRELRDGARPQPDDDGVVISPADGRVDSLGVLDGRSFVVKGRPYQAAELLGDDDEAKHFEGGLGCVVYLSPRDYHRVHSPVGGVVTHVRSMPGDYYPVNEIGVKHFDNLFVRNRRVAIMIDTPDLGRVAVVMVAAMVVGRITVTGIDARDVPFGTHRPEKLEVARGDEIGIFRLGSTAVLFFERRAGLHFTAGEGPIRFGAPLAKRENAKRSEKNDRSHG
jgi:phosphatidylserine decarboxylase